HRCRRRDGLGLTAWIGDRDGICHVVDYNRVVDVVVDHVVRRRGHVSGRTNPEGNRPVDRHWQDEKGYGWWRRREHHEFRRWRRQENDRRQRWRRKAEDGIVEDENRPAAIDNFVRGRRRQVIGYGREHRRRLERGGEKRQAAVGVGRVRSIGIAPQIGPIGGRRVDEAGAPPGDCLAPGSDDRAYPLRH